MTNLERSFVIAFPSLLSKSDEALGSFACGHLFDCAGLVESCSLCPARHALHSSESPCRKVLGAWLRSEVK